MTPGSRRRNRRAIYLAMALPWLLVIAALISATEARADVIDDYTADVASVICDTLDDNPTFRGIEIVGASVIEAAGFTAEQAGRVVKNAIILDCPRHVGLWNRFVTAYGPAREMA